MEEISEILSTLLSFVPVLLLVGIVARRSKQKAKKKEQSEMREAFQDARKVVTQLRNAPRRAVMTGNVSLDDIMKAAFQPKDESEVSDDNDDDDEGMESEKMVPEDMTPEDMTVKADIPEGEDFHSGDFHRTEASVPMPKDKEEAPKAGPGMLAKEMPVFAAEAERHEEEPTRGSGFSLRAEDMRQAIVLSEILDKPVSMRRGRR